MGNPAALAVASVVMLQSAPFAAQPAPAFADSARPNVIVVITDDQGYGDLSLTGNPILKTPNMDQLARSGVQFTNFHVDSYCTPTRAALMTGRYAHRVGGWGTVGGRNMLRDDETTMADVFRNNGYRTGLFGKWHLGASYPYRPMDRGFDEWVGKGDGGTGCANDYWGNDRVNDHYIHNGKWEDTPRPGFESDVFFDAAMQFIRDNKSRPFFTYLAVYNPHGPCSLPDEKWAAAYRGTNLPGNFFATIARIDQNLGRLREFLKTEGLADNTLILFLTDNGTAEGEKVFNAGMRGKKGTPYDGGHRVPCFLHWPAGGFDKPVTVSRLTAHMDLLPTLMDLCALQLPKPIQFDGVSLNPLLANPSADWPARTLVMGAARNNVHANAGPPKYGEMSAVMTDRWRLVNDRELYDMTADPGQKQNVAADHPTVVAELRAAYKTYWQSVSSRDKGWRGCPIIGSPKQPVVHLGSGDWYATQGNCPWNQAAVASGESAFGRWPVRIATAGSYRIELRRWPVATDAPIPGIPTNKTTADAVINGQPVRGLLYGGSPKALPIAQAQLTIAGQTQTRAVAPGDTAVVFTVNLDEGPADIEAVFSDQSSKALCGAYYVAVGRDP